MTATMIEGRYVAPTAEALRAILAARGDDLRVGFTAPWDGGTLVQVFVDGAVRQPGHVIGAAVRGIDDNPDVELLDAAR